MKPKLLAICLAMASVGPVGAADLSADISRSNPPLVIDAVGKIVGRYTYTTGSEIVPVALFDDAGTLTEVTLGSVWHSSNLTFHNTSGLFHTTTDCRA